MLARQIEDWQSVQKRSPSSVGDCQTENGHLQDVQNIRNLIH